MLFPTITFGVFFAVVVLGHTLLLGHRRSWRLFMLGASYVFYGWWDKRFLALVIGSSIGNHFFAKRIAAASDRRRRLVLGIGVAMNLAVLGFFKYADFFVTSFVNGMSELGFKVSAEPLSIVLPIGISFFTFHGISYLVDVYRKELEPADSVLDVCLYVAFFPHMVAGPIVKARMFLPQLQNPGAMRPLEPVRAYGLITSGLFKKVVIADLLATQLVDPVFANPSGHTSLETLAAIYGYGVQIFCDFSAYTDIAIGCAMLLGIRFPQNFNRPYAAVSLQDFWRRWHMSLSTWLRDYLYIPLGGSAGGRLFTARNLMITMLLGGLWHGAAWTFVVWGGLHGAGLTAERLWRERRPTPVHAAEPAGLSRAVRIFLTFNFVCLAWVFFRATSFDRAGEVLGNLGGVWTEAPALTGGVLLALAVGLALQYLPRGWLPRLASSFGRLDPVVQGLTLAVALTFIDTLGAEGVAPFIYFQF
jgi:alginate O-acetyltransferase complex protein AlgI